MIARVLASRAAAHPRRVAIVDGERSCTYAALAERSSRLAGGLAGLGCAPGDRVAILAQNSLEFVEWFYACAAGGFVGLALNPRLGGSVLEQMLADAAPSAVVIDGRSRELAGELRAADALPPVRIGFGAAHGCERDYEDVLAAASSRVHLPDKEPATAMLLTGTSGTTGAPKMTLHTHLGLYAGMQSTQASLRMRPQDRYLTALPMFFATATGGYWIGTLVGGETHLIPAFDAELFVREIDRRGITHSIVGPTPLYQVMDSGIDLAPLRRMTFLGAGGAPFDDGRYRELHERTGGALAAMYAMSELSFSCVLHGADTVSDGRFNDKVGCVGRPQPGADARVLDEEGTDVPADGASVGEVVFSAPGIASRYWSSPEDTAATFVDGTVRSGDLATRDADGFLRIVDRKKDLIVSGGINVAPLEVERVIATHPDVQAVAVVGVPHRTWGEAVHAVVVARPGTRPSAEDITAWAAGRLAPVKKPRSVAFVDALPVNITGKVLRRVLRDSAAAQAAGAES